MNEKVELLNDCINMSHKKIQEIINTYSLALTQNLSQETKQSLIADKDKKISEINILILNFQDTRSDELRENKAK